MSAVLFAPHSDDETLFAFYQLLEHKPKVIVVFESHQQEKDGGPDQATRQAETACAMAIAGVEWEQWPYRDDEVYHPHQLVPTIAEAIVDADVVIAPAYEHGGHEDHNLVASCVGVAAHQKLIQYYTYKRGRRRTELGQCVEGTPDQRLAKIAALECYASQASYGPTAPWFNLFQYGDLREWIAE